MFDKGAHAPEGCFEGREPIRGFFRNIEESLHAVDSSLLLF